MRELLAVAAVMGLAVLARLEHLGTRTLWGDEGFSLDLARRGLSDMLIHLRGVDGHPVGYYLLLSYWIRAFGEDLATMRALSAIFGIAAVVVTWRLGRALFSPLVGIGAAALVALNPFQIFASNELRMYMPLEFLALVSTWVLWRACAFPSEARAFPRGDVWWVVYGATLALMAYLSYYAFLLIPGHLLWIFLHTRQRLPLRQIGVALATAIILYAPWIPNLSGVMAFLSSGQLAVRGQSMWPTYLPELVAAQTFGGYVFNAVTYHTYQALELKYYGLLLIPFVILIASGYRALGLLNRSARNLATLSWVIPTGLIILTSVALGTVTAYHYHLNFLQPFLALFVAAGVVHFRDVVTKVPRPLVTLGAAVSVLAFIAPALENLQSNPEYQAFRYDSAAGLVKNLYQSGDVVIFFPQGLNKTFHFYFNPPGKELGVPVRRGGYSREALQEAIRTAAQSLTADDKRVWLVYGPPIPDGALDDLIEAIEGRGYKRAAVNDFKGVRIGLLVRSVK